MVVTVTRSAKLYGHAKESLFIVQAGPKHILIRLRRDHCAIEMSNSAAPSSRAPAWQHKYVHEMTEEERLESLKAWAEEKKLVTPGEGGTFTTNIGGISSVAFGVPLRTVRSEAQAEDKYRGQYDAPLGPPSYGFATNEQPEKRSGVFKRWLEKRRSKKAARRRDSVPPYVP